MNVGESSRFVSRSVLPVRVSCALDDAASLVLGDDGRRCGLIGFFSAALLLRSYLRGLSSFAPMSVALVGLLLIGIAYVASFLPARRVSRVDPTMMLRE